MPSAAIRARPPRTIGAVFALCTAVVLSIAAASAPLTFTDSPVADASMRGDTAAVRALLKQGADVNAAQGDGMTALHWAATRGDVEQTRMLIYAGARLEAATRNGNYTPLHLAAKGGRTSVVKALLAAGADVNATTSSGGATPLHLAAAEGNPDAVLALIEKGALVNARETAFGETPVMWAAAYNRASAIQVLAARGADLKAVSKVESVPMRDSLDRMALQLRTRRVAALKAAEQPPPPPPPNAAPRGGRGGGGANVDDPAAGGRGGRGGAGGGARGSYPTPGDSTTKDAAKKDSMPGMAGMPSMPTASAPGGLRGRGTAAPPDSQRNINRGPSFGDLVGNKGGLTPLLFAVREGNIDCVTALLKAGADINQVSAGDHTSPLLMATINGQFDIAKLMLDRGADPKLASDAGATPLYATINVQWAAKSFYPQPTAQLNQRVTYLQLMEALINKGADVNARLTKHLWYMSYNFDLLGVNTTGATPFWRAAYGTDVPAMRLLITHGADPNVPTIKPAGRQQGADAPVETDTTKDPSGLAPIPVGGPGVYPIHAASGVGYGDGYAANAHQHAPDSWVASVKYLVEELHLDINARDFNGYNAVHNAAARGDNELILYLVSKGADVKAVSRKGQTTADMANGPVQRIPPFLETVALLEKLGAKNSHKCKSC